jgi:hypothetical protein
MGLVYLALKRFNASTIQYLNITAMKQTLLAIALCVSLGVLADEVPLYYDEFTQNMGVVSLITNGENAPKSGKIYIAQPEQTVAAEQWAAFRKCLIFCLIDAGYDVASSAAEADAVLNVEWVRDKEINRKQENIATYSVNLRLVPAQSPKPLLYMARTIVSPDDGGKSAMLYTLAALLDNGAFNNPHEIDFWMSLDDVAFNELPSVTAMKFLAE